MSKPAIIFASDEYEVVVIDIPTSIAAAQYLENAVVSDSLLSCKAIIEPYHVGEPKVATAKQQASNFEVDHQWHEDLAVAVRRASEMLQCSFSGSEFCLSRRFVEATQSTKRGHEEMLSDRDLPGYEGEADMIDFLSRLARKQKSSRTLQHSSSSDASCYMFLLDGKGKSDDEQDPGRLWDHYFSNEDDQPSMLRVADLRIASPLSDFRFKVPSNSAFLLARCESVEDFRVTSKLFTPETRGKFDIMVLDPPWPNKSAVRKKSYETQYDINSLQRLLRMMDLDMHIMPSGYIAIWVTNRANCRDAVLGSGGFFEMWNVTLIEEWIWLKVTSTGEPMLPINSTFRKPYEVLLIGMAPGTTLTKAKEVEHVKRRVIVAVPDMHSRKPCLKQMFQACFFPQKSYKAVEIFARYLVVGWFSWGDEVLKYNWEKYWQSPPCESDCRV